MINVNPFIVLGSHDDDIIFTNSANDARHMLIDDLEHIADYIAESINHHYWPNRNNPYGGTDALKTQINEMREINDFIAHLKKTDKLTDSYYRDLAGNYYCIERLSDQAYHIEQLKQIALSLALNIDYFGLESIGYYDETNLFCYFKDEQYLVLCDDEKSDYVDQYPSTDFNQPIEQIKLDDTVYSIFEVVA